MAIGLFVYLAFNFVITGVGIVLMLASTYYTIQKYGRQTLASATVKIIWDTDDVWQLETKNGQRSMVTLMPDSYVHPTISILRFNYSSNQRSVWASLCAVTVILLKDNVDEENFRRLRVRLKIGKPKD